MSRGCQAVTSMLAYKGRLQKEILLSGFLSMRSVEQQMNGIKQLWQRNCSPCWKGKKH